MRKQHTRKTIQEVFWDKIQKTKTCWLWTGLPDDFGYGRCWNIERKKVEQAHRLSYEIHNKIKLETSQCVLHNCDVPACVNPEHLYLGSKKDNSRDMVKRGRGKSQFQSGNVVRAKITVETVRKIRQTYKNGNITHKEIGIIYNLHSSTIQNIISYKTWKNT